MEMSEHQYQAASEAVQETKPLLESPECIDEFLEKNVSRLTLMFETIAFGSGRCFIRVFDGLLGNYDEAKLEMAVIGPIIPMKKFKLKVSFGFALN